MRPLQLCFLAVLVAVVVVLGATPALGVPEYRVVTDECVRTGFLPLFCDETMSNDDRLVYKLCSQNGYGLAYITSDQERDLALSAMRNLNVTKAYLGARSTSIANQTYWCWMADAWTFNDSSVFYVGDVNTGGLVYGSRYWLPDFPTASGGSFLQFDASNSSADPGFRNVGGRDMTAFSVLCERTVRDPPLFDGAPTVIEKPTPPTTVQPSTAPDDSTTTNPSSNPDTTTTTVAPLPSEKEKSEFPTWAIGVIVDAVLLVLILAAIGVYCCCIRKGKKSEANGNGDIPDGDSDRDDARSFRSS